MRHIILCLFYLTLPNVFAAEIIITAGDPGTSSTGQWHYASGATMAFNNNKGMYKNLADGNGTYTFSTNIPETTSYTVEVYNSCYTPRSNQVIHRIQHANGIAEHVLQQDCNLDPFVGQWRPLGTYNFNAGTTGTLTIDTTNSNNRYVGATAVRFVYQSTTPANTPPQITPEVTQISVDAGSTFTLNASATDAEDGDISNNISWSSPTQSTTGSSFEVTADSSNFDINLTVQDSNQAVATSQISVSINQPQSSQAKTYHFGCPDLDPLPTNFVSNNPTVLPNVGSRCGRYIAELTDNQNNKTLHYHQQQGRFDGVVLSFPFKVIAHNIGIAPMGQPTANHEYSGTAYLFAGLQVHHINFDQISSAHLVVGQRGGTHNTVEGKNTRNGVSSVNDIGANRLPQGRADLMIEGTANGGLIASWRIAGTTTWNLYNNTGDLPGNTPDWGNGNQVYVGLITYAYGNSGVPFMGVADSLEVVE